MKLVLHIGSDKCGSTAIQRSLFINRDKLKQYGIYVPETGLRHSSGHACCFNRKNSNNKKLFKQLIEELNSVSSAYEISVVSWEGIHFMSESVLYEEYHPLRKFDIKVLYYVREQAEIIQTGILQQWKTSNCGLPFNKITPSNRMYHETADRWSRFAGEKIEVVAYDLSAFPEGDISIDFYSRVKSGSMSLGKSDEKIDNPSLSYESAHLLAFLAGNFEIPEDERPDLVDAISKCQNLTRHSKYFLSEKEVGEIRQHYLESNKILKAKYQADLLSNLKPCWRANERIHAPDPVLLAKSLELFGIPVLKDHPTKRFKLSKSLVSGWHKFEDWGAWANGEESKVLFRLDDKIIMHVLRDSGKTDIEITGRYLESVVRKSDVEINGRHYKNMDLRLFRFSIGADDLNKDGLVEITIKNSPGIRESSGNNTMGDRLLSYGIGGIRVITDKSCAYDDRKRIRKKSSIIYNNIIRRIIACFNNKKNA